MSKIEKLIKKLLSYPKDLTFEELVKILSYLGFEMSNKGKTSGSRVRFVERAKQTQYLLHEPHPKNIIKEKALKDIIDFLIENGYIEE